MAEAAGPRRQDDDRIAGASLVEDDDGLPSNDNGGSTWEIEELEPEERPQQAGGSNAQGGAEASSTTDDVYVAVGKGGSSAAAVSWALRRLTKPRSFVYLVHVFPVVTSIPTPCFWPRGHFSSVDIHHIVHSFLSWLEQKCFLANWRSKKGE